MEEARAELEARRDASDVADGLTHRLQHPVVRRIHLDVGEQREIVARRQAVHMRLQVSGQSFVAARTVRQRPRVLLIREQLDPLAREDRRFCGQRSASFVLGGQLPRGDLARFDVGLIERVDAEDRSGDGRRDLPAEELLAEVVQVVERDAHDRMTGPLEGFDRCVLRRVRRRRNRI